jgi:hypothetical protein
MNSFLGFLLDQCSNHVSDMITKIAVIKDDGYS